jgi:pilus assembly protein CpaB
VVSAVTLELSLDDAEKLDLARSVGTLSLVLRNQVDKQTVATQGITKSELFGEGKPIPQVKAAAPAGKPRVAAAAPVARPAGVCVEVLQNGTASLNCF